MIRLASKPEIVVAGSTVTPVMVNGVAPTSDKWMPLKFAAPKKFLSLNVTVIFEGWTSVLTSLNDVKAAPALVTVCVPSSS